MTEIKGEVTAHVTSIELSNLSSYDHGTRGTRAVKQAILSLEGADTKQLERAYNSGCKLKITFEEIYE